MKDAKTGRFLTGNNGGGRKPGSRNKLSAEFLDALYLDFAEHGVAVIQKVRTEAPQAYLKVVAGLMPAKLEAQLEAQVNVDVFHHDDTSIADILEKVAQEAGPEAAMQLAAIFGIEPADDLTEGQILLPPKRARSYHPTACYDANGQPTYCTCEVD